LTLLRLTYGWRSHLFCLLAPIGLVFLACCGLTGMVQAQTTADIHDISVFPTSPYLNDSVTTTGIVIAVLSDGFYIENQSNWDQDTCTSEGIYVYTPAITPSKYVALQDSVTVTGLVEASNSSNYAGVQIYIASPVVGSNIVINSSGNTLPTTVTSSTLTAATSGTCSSYGVDAFGQWLPFEGMRVNIPSSSTMLVTQGTGGTVTPAAQTATTNGQFWAVLTTTRPTRSAGISILDPVYATAIAAKSTIQEWSGNPQLLFVDSTALGGAALDASATTEYNGSAELVGIVDYHLSTQGYTGLLLTSASVSALASQNGATPTKVTTRGSSDEITIATQDLNSLTAAETKRITKLAYAIVDYHKSPDIVAVQGATADALSALVSAITSAGGPTYTLTEVSTADSSGMENAFLVNSSVFDGTPTAVQILTSNTYTNTASTASALFGRSPLVLTAKILRAGISDYVMYIVNTTLLSRSGLSSTSTGEDARLQREEQAEALAAYLYSLESAGDHVMVVGGFDSFEFSDGYVDTLGILDGLETTNTDNGAYVWTYYGSSSSSLVDTTTSSPNLTATASAGTPTVTPATNRYTYVESGTAEQPDHILISSDMSSLISIDYARFGADFPDSLTYKTSTTSTDTMVERASTHDGIVAYFTIPYPTMTTVVTSGSPSYYDDPVTFTAKVCVVDSSDTSTCVSTAGTPDGTVTYKDTDGTVLGTAAIDSSTGQAAFTYSKLAVGTHTITASYGGSESGLGYQASSGTVEQVVQKDISSLALSSAPNPSSYGQPVIFTATATSAKTSGSGEIPTGTVTYYEGSTVLGTATLSSGVVTLTISTLTVGTHTIVAEYGGDTTDTEATSNTVDQVVNPNTSTVTVTSSKNPSYNGDSVTFTATVVGSYGVPTGTVTFYDGTTVLGAGTLAASTATYTATTTYATSSLTVGSHTIVATYAGDGTHDGASGSMTQVVDTNTTTLTLTSGLNPSYYSESVTFTVTAVGASGTPTGTVLINYGTTALGSATLNSGTATFATSALPVGTDAIQAVYGGYGVHDAANSSTVDQVVLPVYATTSTLSCTPNPAEYQTTVTCTDSVAASTGTPSGTVTFYDGTTSLGTVTLDAGTASWSSASLVVGSHPITAVYALNYPYLSGTSNEVDEIIVSTFSLTAKPTSATIYTGETATSTITVTPGDGFTLDVALTCSGLPSTATCTLTPSTVSGGSGTSKLVVQTAAPSRQTTTASLGGMGRGWPLMATVLLLFVPRRLRRRGIWLAGLLVAAVIASMSLGGCGGSSTLTGGTPAGTYTVTVTGTAVDGSLVLTQSTTVTVKVESLF
jgi:hypothetical protein